MLSPAFRSWHIHPSDDHARGALTDSLRLHPITAAVLVARGTLVKPARVMGNKHLKPTLRGSQYPSLTAFGYGMGTSREFADIDHVDVAGSLEINTWNGTDGVQLRIKDVRPSQCGDVGSC